MKNSLKRSLICLLVILLPYSCFAALTNGGFEYFALVISVFNKVLMFTSAICIKQYFFLGDRNQTKFQVINLIFAVVFYIVALSFLISEKSFYLGFEQLSAAGCIRKFFFGDGIYSWLQWIVITGMVFNVIYIRKYHDA